MFKSYESDITLQLPVPRFAAGSCWYC